MTPLLLRLCLHCSNVRLSQRQTVHIWWLTFLHKSCCTALIIICALILSSPSVCHSYDPPRETRKFKVPSSGRVEAMPSHPKAPCHFQLLLRRLVLPLNLGFMPSFSSPNCLLFHFSLSHFLISPVYYFRSFVEL